MKRRLSALGLAVLLVVTAGHALADSPPAVQVSRVGPVGGGVSGHLGMYNLYATVGQPVTHVATSGALALCPGFWCGAGVPHLVYLPLVIRGG